MNLSMYVYDASLKHQYGLLVTPLCIDSPAIFQSTNCENWVIYAKQLGYLIIEFVNYGCP